MKKLTHTIEVGRFEVTGQYEGVPIAHDGSLGIYCSGKRDGLEAERADLGALTPTVTV